MKKLISLFMIISLVCTSFAACGGKGDKKSNSSASDTENKSSSEPVGKYENAEVYENNEGVPTAKTEDGTEVEITGENMQTLLEEYEKVKGTGSKEEREVLDKLQLILEASN